MSTGWSNWLAAVAVMAAITFALRALPFLLPGRWHDRGLVRGLRRDLPPAIMLILVAYSLGGTAWTASPHGLPELLAVAAVTVLHLAFGNPLVSIVAGTGGYMVLRALLA